MLPEHERELLLAVVFGLRSADRRFSPDACHPRPWRKPAPTALFLGPPGTGKTMAAQILGAELGLPVLEVGLDSLLSLQQVEEEREIIARMFDVAEAFDAILVFDHAETVLGGQPRSGRPGGLGALLARKGQAAPQASREPQRGGAPDRTLSELLTRSVRYRGLVIFVSTTTRGIDESLAGRFEVVVRFPFPDRDARKEIWRQALPSDARLTESGLEYLATWLRWPGSTIRSCSLAATSEAAAEDVPVQLHHVATMLQRGYRTQVPPGYAQEVSSPENSQKVPASTGSFPAEPRSGIRIPRVLRHAGTISALSGAFIAAVLGSIVAGALTRPWLVDHASKSARAGVVEISYPSNWRTESRPTRRQPQLTDELALAPTAPARGLLLVGRTTAQDASALPQSLIAGLGPAAAPQAVKIGQVSLYRYVTPSRPGPRTSQSLYAVPTTVGTIVAVCTTDGGPAGFMSNCERVLGTIRLTSGSFVPLGLDASYAHALGEVIATLNAVRVRAAPRLVRATNAHAQAAAATELAAAHMEAASALLRIGAGSATVANSAVASALQLTAKAYSALALAIAHNDGRSYSAARASLVRAGGALSAAFGQLSKLGYHFA